MEEKKDGLWYWNTFARASSIYSELPKQTDASNWDKKNKLLEIMVGSLLGFIEENFTTPDPVSAQSIIVRSTLPTEDESEEMFNAEAVNQ